MNISDRSLSEACAILRDQRLDTLPTEEEHVFSDVFERKMKQLFSRAKKKFFVFKAMQTAAVIFLSIAITGSTVVAVNASARERLQNWIKDRVESWTVYKAERSLAEWNDVEILIDERINDYSFELLDKTPEMIVMLITSDQSGALLICDITEHERFILMPDYEYTQTLVKGETADFYKVYEEHGTNELFWTDKSSGILLNISGNYSMEEMVYIANNITIHPLLTK